MVIRPALEAEHTRASASCDIAACRTRPVIPLAPEVQIVPFPQELLPNSWAFCTEADMVQALVSPALAAGQVKASAPFDIEPCKT